MFWQAFSEQTGARRAFRVLVGITAGCLLLPLVWPWEMSQIDFDVLRAQAPSLRHPLGTDTIGRDELARLLYAGRISLLIGVMVALISAAVGTLVGIAAGYLRGVVDSTLMALVDLLLTVPSLPLLMAMSVLVASPDSKFGAIVRSVPEEWRIILIMSVLGWMSISRMVRSQVLALRQTEYVEAAEAFGASRRRVMFMHILPNTVPTIVIFCTFAVSAAVLGESGLSFLGMGVNPPTPTWGNMIMDTANVAMVTHYWWLAWAPALCILTTVLCINVVADGVRAALNPQTVKK